MKDKVDPTPFDNRHRDKKESEEHPNGMKDLNIPIEMNENIIIEIRFKQVW